jgi:hypothetical protein
MFIKKKNMMMRGDKMKAMMKYLTGGQVKLDKNKDGKISGADFKMMMAGSKMGYAKGGKTDPPKQGTPPVRTWDKGMHNEYIDYIFDPRPENKPDWYFGDIDIEGNPVDTRGSIPTLGVSSETKPDKVPVEKVVGKKGMRMKYMKGGDMKYMGGGDMKYMQGGDMEAAAMQGQQMEAPSRMDQIKEMIMSLSDDERAMVAQLLSER